MWRDHSVRMIAYDAGMPPRKLRKTYIREWRERRGLSLRQLAGRMESEPGVELISYASIGRIETGEQPYSQEILEAMAEALGVTVSMLLEHNPEREGRVVELFSQMPPDRQKLALDMMETLAKTG